MQITVNLSGIVPSNREITPVIEADDHSKLVICVVVRNAAIHAGEELLEGAGQFIEKRCGWMTFTNGRFEIDLEQLTQEYKQLSEVTWAKGKVNVRPKVQTIHVHGSEEIRSAHGLSQIQNWRLAAFNCEIDEQTVADSNIVFFSWMSDRPREFNTQVIEKAAEAAIKEMKKESEVVGLQFDRDTRGTRGAVDIADVIFDKIRKCRAFIADVTIIGDTGTRLTSNPNVLVELGYAVGVHGWDRIILVCNEAYGKVEEVPFDLRGRRTMKYILNDSVALEEVRENLKGGFKAALKEIAQ
jgi:hypothetical protein